MLNYQRVYSWGFHKWIPNSWMVYGGKNHLEMDDLGVLHGTPFLGNLHIWQTIGLHGTLFPVQPPSNWLPKHIDVESCDQISCHPKNKLGRDGSTKDIPYNFGEWFWGRLVDKYYPHVSTCLVRGWFRNISTRNLDFTSDHRIVLWIFPWIPGMSEVWLLRCLSHEQIPSHSTS
jgi:hypothetical protein